MTVQRRLAAILAADVVGFSRLMAADEAGTLATLAVLHGPGARAFLDEQQVRYELTEDETAAPSP